jgi:hypothetical protein
MEDNKYTDMLIYFLRPPSLAHMLYTELFNAFSVTAQPSNTFLTSKIRDVDYFEISCPFIDRVTYLTKRKRENKSITRMEMVYPNAGEIFYLRLILLHKPCRNFDDACKLGTEEFSTFQMSALANGYVDNEYEANKCFTEAAVFSSPSELRFLFATMTLEGFPTHGIFYTPATHNTLIEDYKHSTTVIQSEVSYFNQLLSDLSSHFAERNQSLGAYGLPEPEVVNTELDREFMKYDCQQQAALLTDLHLRAPNNPEQETVFHLIVSAIDSGRTRKMFLHGKGGCGKTTLAKKLMAYCRSQGHVALGCASTGLSACIYEDFYTAHSCYRRRRQR